jgi:ABC-type antimicrobial peptide transport system permease subunit
MTADPPRLAIVLLRAALPAPDADAIAGDLTEVFTARADGGRSLNALWFWSAALAVVLRFALAGVRADRREARRRAMFDRVWTGYRQSLRRLRFEWRYAVGVVVVLAIGIGPAAAMLSIVEKVSLRPLGYAHAERLGIIRVGLGQLTSHPGLALSEILDLRRTEGLFEGVEAEARRFELSLGSGPSMRPVSAIGVTPGLLPMIGVSPALGRTFTDADAKAEPAAPVMIDYGLWQSSFGGSPDIVGRRVLLDGRSTEIIGVLPRGFTLVTGRSVPEPVDVYTTLLVREHRNFWGFPTIVRLEPGVSYEAANAALENLSQKLSQEYPVEYGSTGVRLAVTPLKDDLVRDTRSALRAALAAVLLLLLVAVANATALVIARLKVRERELAVRSAIGAGRAALAVEVLMESVILGVAAAVVGSAIAGLCVAGARALVPHTVPRWRDITLGWELVLYSGGFALAGLFVAGLVPL